MALVIGDLLVKLRLNESQFTRGLDTASSKASATSAKMGVAGAAMAAAISVPLTLLTSSIVQTAARFEQEMNKVQALTGATAQEFEALQRTAKDLGATTKFSATESAQALSFLAMAGFEADEAMAAMPATLNLAASANLELGQAADVVSNILTGYGKNVDELDGVVDVLAKTFTSTNTDLVMLGQAMKYAGPVASGAGVEFTTAAAAIGLMGNAGIQASMAGTSLRGAIAKIVSPTSEASKIMKELGLSFIDATGKMLPFDQVIQQLEPHAKDTSVMMELFGLRAGPAMMGLISQGSSALRELTAELDASGGTAKRIADVQMRGFSGEMLRLKSMLEAVKLDLADLGLLAFSTRVVKASRLILEAFNGLDDATKRTTAKWIAIFAAAGPLLLILAGFVKMVGYAFGSLSVMIGPLLTVFRTALTAGLVAATLAGKLALKPWFMGGAIITAFVFSHEYMFAKAVEWWGKMQAPLENWLRWSTNTLRHWSVYFAAVMIKTWHEIQRSTADMFQQFGRYLTEFITWTSETIVRLWEIMKDPSKWKDAADVMARNLTAGLNVTTTLFNEFLGITQKSTNEFLSGIDAAVEKATKSISGFMTEAKTLADEQSLTGIDFSGLKVFNQDLGDIGKQIVERTKEIGEAVAGINIGDSFREASNSLPDEFKATLELLKIPLEEFMIFLKGIWVEAGVNVVEVVDKAAAQLDALFAEYDAWKEMNEQASKQTAESTSIWDTMGEAMTESLPDAVDTAVSEMITGLIRGTQSMAEVLDNFSQNIVASWAEDLVKQLDEEFSHIGDKVASSVMVALATAADIVSSFASGDSSVGVAKTVGAGVGGTAAFALSGGNYLMTAVGASIGSAIGGAIGSAFTGSGKGKALDEFKVDPKRFFPAFTGMGFAQSSLAPFPTSSVGGPAPTIDPSGGAFRGRSALGMPWRTDSWIDISKFSLRDQKLGRIERDYAFFSAAQDFANEVGASILAIEKKPGTTGVPFQVSAIESRVRFLDEKLLVITENFARAYRGDGKLDFGELSTEAISSLRSIRDLILQRYELEKAAFVDMMNVLASKIETVKGKISTWEGVIQSLSDQLREIKLAGMSASEVFAQINEEFDDAVAAVKERVSPESIAVMQGVGSELIQAAQSAFGQEGQDNFDLGRVAKTIAKVQEALLQAQEQADSMLRVYQDKILTLNTKQEFYQKQIDIHAGNTVAALKTNNDRVSTLVASALMQNEGIDALGRAIEETAVTSDSTIAGAFAQGALDEQAFMTPLFDRQYTTTLEAYNTFSHDMQNQTVSYTDALKNFETSNMDGQKLMIRGLDTLSNTIADQSDFPSVTVAVDAVTLAVKEAEEGIVAAINETAEAGVAMTSTAPGGTMFGGIPVSSPTMTGSQAAAVAATAVGAIAAAPFGNISASAPQVEAAIRAQYGAEGKQITGDIPPDVVSAATAQLAFMGTVYPNLLGAFQHGGLVTKPTAALIGEMGPEAVIPLNKMDTLTGGTTIKVTGNTILGDDLSTARELARLLKPHLASVRSVSG